MENFEQVRAHVSGRHALRSNDPYLISLDLEVAAGERLQGVYLAELEGDDGQRFLRVSSPVAPLGSISPERCLRFNWEQRVGYLAVNDLDGVAYLQLCENRPYDGVDNDRLDRLIHAIGNQADQLERAAAGGDAH